MNEQRTILITGGSGFIGTKLTAALVERGYRVMVVDMVPPRVQHEHLAFTKANLARESLDPALVERVWGVINLAGATIGKRWTHAYQQTIYDSRIRTTQALVAAITRAPTKPRVLVSASAVGYYGDQKDKLLTEEAPPGRDFLARVCVDWEAAAHTAHDAGLRVVIIRTAHVLGPGGLLSSLEPLFKKGLGGYFGSGRQYMPWIHWKDVVGIYIRALEEESMTGPYNVGAGGAPTQSTLFRAFAKAIGVRIVWRVPFVVARIVLGRFAGSLMASQRTVSDKIRAAGYVYEYTDLTAALKDIYRA